jgi:stage V sporulation protein AD
LVSTGALMSTTTSQQGDTIPGIAHAVELEFNNLNKVKEKIDND